MQKKTKKQISKKEVQQKIEHSVFKLQPPIVKKIQALLKLISRKSKKF